MTQANQPYQIPGIPAIPGIPSTPAAPIQTSAPAYAPVQTVAPAYVAPQTYTAPAPVQYPPAPSQGFPGPAPVGAYPPPAQVAPAYVPAYAPAPVAGPPANYAAQVAAATLRPDRPVRLDEDFAVYDLTIQTSAYASGTNKESGSTYGGTRVEFTVDASTNPQHPVGCKGSVMFSAVGNQFRVEADARDEKFFILAALGFSNEAEAEARGVTASTIQEIVGRLMPVLPSPDAPMPPSILAGRRVRLTVKPSRRIGKPGTRRAGQPYPERVWSVIA